jgi:hypothetical protein
MPVLRLIAKRLRDAEKTVRGATPFYIQKAIGAVRGTVRNVSQLNNCMLLLEVHSKEQAEIILKTQTLLSV